MTSFGNLYVAYRALRTDENGDLRTDMVSNDPEKVEAYRLSMVAYRKVALSSLPSILRQLSERFMEEYNNSAQMRTVEGYQIYVKCDHVSPADVKMSRANEIEMIDSNDYDVCGYIHVCNACKAVLGTRFGEVAVLQND